MTKLWCRATPQTAAAAAVVNELTKMDWCVYANAEGCSEIEAGNAKYA